MTRSTPTLEVVLATSLDAVVVIEESGLIAGWNENAERIFGYSKAEALHQPVADLIIPPNQRDGHAQGMSRYLSTGEVHVLGKRLKMTAIQRNGSEFPVELAVMVYSGVGNRCFIGFIRDLTEETAAAARIETLSAEVLQLSRLNAMGTAASMIAHEVNQPLAAANNYLAGCRRIARRLEGDELADLREGISLAQAAVFRAAEVVKVVRDIVAKKPILPSRLSLGSIIRDTLKLVSSSLEASPDVRLEPRAKYVSAIKGQIDQVFLNIIRNAIEATKNTSDPVLICSSRLRNGQVEICIRDNGPGVSPEAMEHLFTPFETSKTNGLGIGLSICRTVVEEHKGKIWVESDADGTAVFFTLPVG